MTPFGAVCRQLREIHCVSMRTQAVAISVSPSYLSALERGVRGTPSNRIIMSIAKYYSLSAEKYQELRRAAEESTPNFTLPKGSHPKVYRIARLITQRADNLSEKEIKLLEDVLIDERAMGGI